MQGKCERGHCFSTPGLRFHGMDRADVYYNICVRAIRCGKCALNPPTSQPIPRRRPSPAPAQRHALAEHFRSPTQRRRSPADCAMHSPPKPSPAPHSDTPSPNTSAPPRSPDARPPTARYIPRSATHPPEHFCSPTQRRCTSAGYAMHSPPKAFAHPRSAPRCLSFRSALGTKKRHRTVHVRCRMSRSTVVAVGHLGW